MSKDVWRWVTQGTIPPGNYGAGQVGIWDQGVYAPSAVTPGRVVFTALGRRFNGVYRLVRMEGNNWLLTMLASGEGSDEVRPESTP